MKPGFFQGKKFPFTPKRRKKSLGSQCNNIIDTRHDLAAFRSKLANVSWLRSYMGKPKDAHVQVYPTTNLVHPPPPLRYGVPAGSFCRCTSRPLFFPLFLASCQPPVVG